MHTERGDWDEVWARKVAKWLQLVQAWHWEGTAHHRWRVAAPIGPISATCLMVTHEDDVGVCPVHAGGVRVQEVDLGLLLEFRHAHLHLAAPVTLHLKAQLQG
jgi:hypothetical protein